jgi:hypothetical protein
MDRRRADTFDWVAVFELMLLTPVVITRELMLQLRGVVRGVSRQFSIAPLLLQFANRSPADTQRIYSGGPTNHGNLDYYVGSRPFREVMRGTGHGFSNLAAAQGRSRQLPRINTQNLGEDDPMPTLDQLARLWVNKE